MTTETLNLKSSTASATKSNKMTTEILDTADLIKDFTAAFTSDDIESWRNLLASNGEWKIMATGETFTGVDQMTQLAGTKFELPIMLMCEIQDGKIFRVREYFDLLTLTEPGTPHHLYS